MSGIGKGVSTASLGRVLKSYGFNVTAVKIDPYLNVDAGTMNPIEHGEVFVTEDGVECDQDIGNYERFLDEDIPRENYMTSGLVYKTVIEKERNLEYGGKCVEHIPHLTKEVTRRLNVAARKTKADFVLVEIGGTIGEYQNAIFIEAARMMKLEHPKDVLFILVSYLPVPKIIGEMKTKPTQSAARIMNSMGIQPDFIIARSTVPLDEPRKRKVSTFCNVSVKDVISAPDIKSIYEVPINFEKDKLGERILGKFGMRKKRKDMKDWRNLLEKVKNTNNEIHIGIIGKYFATGNFVLSDSYISVIEAVKHASWHLGRKPVISWLNSENYEKDSKKLKELKRYDGVIIPGGFGSRGVKGKILAIKYARENKIPFLGLCYGLQLAVIEFARNVCGMKGANSAEINPSTKYPIIHVLPEQIVNIKNNNMGGSMRLGAYSCRVLPKTIAFKAYGEKLISERHRHRYEVNNELRDALEKKGFVFSGINPERNLVEIAELKGHPFFLGTQFHPEFKSRPLNPHPIFKEFIRISSKSAKK